MKISPTFYNKAGELMAPREVDIKRSPATMGGTPGMEADFYHNFMFETQTEKERTEKARRFFDIMQDVPGFSTLVLRPYRVQIGTRVRHGYEIIYAIESAERARTAALEHRNMTLDQVDSKNSSMLMQYNITQRYSSGN